ncbi:hypothetical protein ABBQ38_002579 [Trebouxia sp. C0009 RCD-2024]
MDGQLDPVKQDICNIQERIVRYEQKLAVAEQAGNKEEEKSLINLLSSLQEKENILLRSQAPSQAVTESDLATTLADIQARVAELSIQQNRASQTNRQLRSLGRCGHSELISSCSFLVWSLCLRMHQCLSGHAQQSWTA